MIYITYHKSNFSECQTIKNVWDVHYNDVEEQYISFIKEKAQEINITINPHWLNIMNWQDYNNHISIGEYHNKEKQWNKILRQWNIDKFISEKLRGRKLNFRNVIRF